MEKPKGLYDWALNKILWHMDDWRMPWHIRLLVILVRWYEYPPWRKDETTPE
jgi:hypothetical protein